MINANTIDLVETAITPFVVTKVIGKEEVAEVINALKTKNIRKEDKQNEELLTRKELAKKWKRSVVTIRKMEREKKIFAEEFSGNKKVFRMWKIKFFEATNTWPKKPGDEK